MGSSKNEGRSPRPSKARPALSAAAPSSLIKEARLLAQARWFFGTLVHYLLSPLVWIRLLILAPTPCVSTHWPVRQQAEQAWSLDSILLTIKEEPIWPSRGKIWTNLKNNESCSVGNDWGLERTRSRLTLSFHITISCDCRPKPSLQGTLLASSLFHVKERLGSRLRLEPGTK